MLFSLVAMSSAFYNGIGFGNDFYQHYQFALTTHASIVSGEIYSGFTARVNNGFGDVGLRFYPPFSYYFLNTIYFLVHDWYFASLITFFLVFLISGIGTYFLAKEELSPPKALVAAAIYILAPYHLNQIYNSFLFAEFVATAIIPFCFLFITRICQKRETYYIWLLGIAYALLILTHLPLTIITSIALGIYALILLKKETFTFVLPRLLLAFISGLVLSSFFWSRIITELDWVKHNSSAYFSDKLSYRHNFLFLPENILNIKDDVLDLWLVDLMLLAIAFLTIPSLIFLIKKRFPGSRFTLAIGVIFILSVFMTIPLSSFIWDNFSLLQKVQFPWRWMSIVTLFGAIFASDGIIRTSDSLKDGKNFLLPIGLGAIFLFFGITSSIIVKGSIYFSYPEFNQKISNLVTSESFECWWTQWAQKSAFAQSEKVLIENRMVNVNNWASTQRTFSISAGEAGQATVATLYYPHWKATVNGQPVEVSPTENGLISFPALAEKAEVRLYFEEPQRVKFAFYISGLAWIILFGLLLFNSAKIVLKKNKLPVLKL